MADRTPYRQSDSDVLVIPLRSDPPWLLAGLAGVTLGSVGLFMLYFWLLTPSVPVTLALLPGLAVATFAGAGLAWWGRRRGATVRLEADSRRLTLHEPANRRDLIDRSMPFGAMIVQDTSTRRRVLVLSQHSELFVLLDTGPLEPLAGVWQDRTVDVDLSGVALSPASANVLTVTVDRSIGPLLASMARDVTGSAPLLSFPLPSGQVLYVHRDEIQLGANTVRLGPSTTVRPVVIQHGSGSVSACEFAAGGASIVLSAEEHTEGAEPFTPPQGVDACLPPFLFATVCALFKTSSLLISGGVLPAGQQ